MFNLEDLTQIVNLLKLQLGDEFLEHIPALLRRVLNPLLHLLPVKSDDSDAASHVQLLYVICLRLQLEDGLVQEVMILGSEVLHIHGGVLVVDLHEVVILLHKLVHVIVHGVYFR